MTDMPLAIGAFGCAFGIASPNQSEFTALRALKIAKRRLRPDVRDSLLYVSSASTDASFLPTAWRFGFLDRATRGRLRSVIVAAHVSSEHPEIQEAFKASSETHFAPSKPLRAETTLLDSDQALARVQFISDLKGYSGVIYRLSVEKGGEAVWRLSFYSDGDNPVACFRLRGRGGALLPME